MEFVKCWLRRKTDEGQQTCKVEEIERHINMKEEYTDKYLNNDLDRVAGNYHIIYTFEWCHNVRDGVSNHQLHNCLLNRSFRRKSKK